MHATDTENGFNLYGRRLVRWGLYPVTWIIILGAFYLLYDSESAPKTIWAATTSILAVLYLLVEFLFPYERRWRMTVKSFLMDLRYLILNSIFVSVMSVSLGFFTITLSGDLTGPASGLSAPIQLALCLLIFEASNYSIHRAMHEMRGGFGRFLWRSHAAHHLPPRLYLVMHAVFHPINGMAIQALALVLPIWLMGYSQNVVVMFLILNGAHGLISHFNVDIRMGWANYIFVGPELHRYHHSADVGEAKNYGATLSVYDQLFGTFVYRPGVAPAQLGVAKNSGLPAYENIVQVLALPFKAR